MNIPLIKVFLSSYFLLFFGVRLASATPLPVQSSVPKCVNVYYDRVPEEKFILGRIHATLLQNLLGHFANVKQIVSPIEIYQPGDIERCAATIYLGTHYLKSS